MGINEAPKFWAGQEKCLLRPIDTAVTKIRPDKVVEFIAGCERIQRIVDCVKPDVIFLPQRGAAPIGWALDELTKRKNGRLVVYLPLGTHSDVMSGDVKGLDHPGKRKAIESGLRYAVETLGKVEKPMLIDEVQSGGTLKEAAYLMLSEMDRQRAGKTLYVVAVQDNSNGWLTHKKVKGFCTLVSNTREHVRSSIVEVPFFSVDRQEFLDHILYPSDAPMENRPAMQMYLRNTQSENFIRCLTAGYLHPHCLSTALEMLKGSIHKDFQSHGTQFRRIYEWMLTLVHQKEPCAVKSEDVVKWLTAFNEAVINNKTRNHHKNGVKHH